MKSMKWLAAVAVAQFACPSLASDPKNIQIVTPNQGINQQSATGSVNQSPVGGINSNYQINNTAATDYGFGPGIYCRSPHLSVGGFSSSSSGGMADFSESTFNDFGGIVALSFPLPSEITSNCKKLAAEIAKQRQLDTQINLIRQCALLKKEGIEFDIAVFPEFEKCSAVKVSVQRP
jgi:hypothetical protein